MSNNEKRKLPLFTDLFYAAVIGFAISKVESGNKIEYYLYSMVTIAFVVEDWYVYYKRVVPEIVESRPYNLYNIFVETAILFSWSVSFTGAITENAQFFLFFAIFMGIRWWGGIHHHSRHKSLFSRLAFGEHAYGISSAVSGIFFYWSGIDKNVFGFLFTVNAAAWFFVVLANWTVYYEHVDNNGT